MMRLFAGVLLLVSTAMGADKVILPGPASGLGYAMTYAADALLCWTVAPTYPIINATKLGAYLNSTDANSTTISIAIFPNSDSGTALASKTGLGISGDFKVTGLTPFSITAGTLYRLCMCGASANVIALSAVQRAPYCCDTRPITGLMQALEPTFYGTAANSCTTGALPATTGVIAAKDLTNPFAHNMIPMFVVEQ